MISDNKINQTTLSIQLFTVIVIVLSYFTTRIINIVSALACVAFIISKQPWNQKFALLYFLFPFTSVFTFREGQTSIFMVLRIAIIATLLLYEIRSISAGFILKVLAFTMYCLFVSVGNGIDMLRLLINIVMWIVIINTMQSMVDGDSSLPISRSFSNGVILSAIVGMYVDYIPGMKYDLMENQVISISDNADYVQRFNGLFGDPNLFVVLVCMALWAMFYEYHKGRIKTSEFLVRTITCTVFGMLTYSKSAILFIAFFWICVVFFRNTIKSHMKAIIIFALGFGSVYFLYSNPQWLEGIIYRFTSNDATLSVDRLTTGRSELWSIYMDYMLQTNSWISGNGLGFLVPYGRAAHNLYLQLLYNIGFIGIYFYFILLKSVYKNSPNNKLIVGVDKIGIGAIICLAMIAFFLDLFLLETLYYMLSLCFIYMKKTESSETTEKIGGLR